MRAFFSSFFFFYFLNWIFLGVYEWLFDATQNVQMFLEATQRDCSLASVRHWPPIYMHGWIEMPAMSEIVDCFLHFLIYFFPKFCVRALSVRGTHRSLKWQPNAQCNSLPIVVFRFWTIFGFSVRLESIVGVWWMPNWRWKHMDCCYLNVRWKVSSAWTHTYVFCTVRVHLLAGVQLASPFRNWMNAYLTMNPIQLLHCTDRNTNFDLNPFLSTKKILKGISLSSAFFKITFVSLKSMNATDIRISAVRKYFQRILLSSFFDVQYCVWEC